MNRCSKVVRRLGWAAAALALAFGCERPASRTHDTLSLARPHLADFARFARWAERALRTHAGAAAGEMLFSPLRLESDVLDAVVWVKGDTEARYALRDRGTEPLEASRLGLVPRGEHAGLRVARSRCRKRRGGARGGRVPCVWLMRAWPADGLTPPWVLWVAYRAESTATTGP